MQHLLQVPSVASVGFVGTAAKHPLALAVIAGSSLVGLGIVAYRQPRRARWVTHLFVLAFAVTGLCLIMWAGRRWPPQRYLISLFVAAFVALPLAVIFAASYCSPALREGAATQQRRKWRWLFILLPLSLLVLGGMSSLLSVLAPQYAGRIHCIVSVLVFGGSAAVCVWHFGHRGSWAMLAIVILGYLAVTSQWVVEYLREAGYTIPERVAEATPIAFLGGILVIIFALLVGDRKRS